jgi:S1-C subfamily serine protease
MNKRLFALVAALGCGVFVLLAVAGVAVLVFFPLQLAQPATSTVGPTAPPGIGATQEVIPTLTPPAAGLQLGSTGQFGAWSVVAQTDVLDTLYDQVNRGVVSIQVYVQRGGLSGSVAGSGFLLDQQGRIVTNNHVIAEGDLITVIFHDGTEVEAQVVGTDADSDLAVIQVNEIPGDAVALPLADSEQVVPGDPVIAIGNPFRLGGTMTFGIVSAVGRTIPAGQTPFSIPQAIQTDAAINPGNSGGPLLNLDGEVIGVNAQIATGGGGQTNAGVGFAIPANVVRRVTPALIENGRYEWPWLGVEGGSVNLLIAEANDLPTQNGGYIDTVRSNSPADRAGLQGSTGSTDVQGFPIRTGGDVIVEAGGEPVRNWSDLLVAISARNPGDALQLTVLRDGQRQQLAVTLEARP